MKDLLHGIVLYNGFLNPREPRFISRFRAAAESLGIRLSGAPSGVFSVGGAGVHAFPEADFCLFFDKDWNLCRALEARGIPVFNDLASNLVCDDKALQIQTVGAECFPETLFAPKSYFADACWTGLEEVGARLGFPLVVKECFGSWGEQVYLAKDGAELERIFRAHSDKPLLFQKFVKESAGTDARVLVAGGRVLGAIRRRAKAGEFRANVELGATAESLALDGETQTFCVEAARRAGATFCGVDLLFGKDRVYLCELNANPGFEGFSQVFPGLAERGILEAVRAALENRTK